MRARVYIVLVLWVVLGALSLFSAEASGKSFLWEIETKGKPSYILGSVHLLKESDYPLNKNITEAFEKSDTLVLEVDISGDNEMKMAGLLFSRSQLKGDQTLKKILSAEDYERVKKGLKEVFSADIKLYEKQKPWFIAMMAEMMSLVKMGFNAEMGVEKHFLKKRKNRKVVALETVESQIGAFDGLPMEDQGAFLIHTLEEIGKLKSVMDSLLRAWKSGDTQALANIMLEGYLKNDKFKNIYKRIIVDRNIHMANSIYELLKKDQGYFIMVGAGHLVGKQNIIELLSKKGLKLIQK